MTAARYIARAVELADGATPGPWQFLNKNSWGGKSAVADSTGHPLAFVGDGDLFDVRSDAEFIAFARDFVPKAAAALGAVLALAPTGNPELIEAGYDIDAADLLAAIESALGGAE